MRASTRPEADFESFAGRFFEACPAGARRDVQDMGGEYRSASKMHSMSGSRPAWQLAVGLDVKGFVALRVVVLAGSRMVCALPLTTLMTVLLSPIDPKGGTR